MTGLEALESWLRYLTLERRCSLRTVESYRHCVASYLTFLDTHRGEEVGLSALGALQASDLRAFLAFRRAGERGLAARSLSQSLSAIRSFHGYLDRRLDTPNAAISQVRGPKIRPGLPRPGDGGPGARLDP